MKPARITRRRLLRDLAAAAPLCAAGAPFLQGCGEQAAVPSLGVSDLGAREVVDRIRKGELGAEGYAAHLVKQYQAHKHLNPIITLDEPRLMEAARAVDQARARGDQLGQLAGLPFTVKDNIDVAGYPTTLGNAALKGYIPKRTAPVVQSAVDKGAIVFAKTNLPVRVGGDVPLTSFSSMNRFFGHVRNPYDSNRVVGGSSGGNGCAVAARIIPAAIGEDSGGSVRIPAALCGVAGLRPTTRDRKRYSDAGFPPEPAPPNKTMGPMARTVADVAFVDAAITGETVPTVVLQEVRVGIPRPDYWERDFIDPGVAQVMQAALAKLKDAGAQLVECDLEQLIDLAAGDRLSAATGGGPRPSFPEWLAANVPGVTLEQVYAGYPMQEGGGNDQPELSAEERAAIIAEAFGRHAELFQSNGLRAIAFPTMPIRAPLIQQEGKLVDDRGAPITQARWANTRAGSRLGVPGLSLPAGLADGLPVGLELDAMPGEDSWLLGLGIAVEQVLGPITPPALAKLT